MTAPSGAELLTGADGAAVRRLVAAYARAAAHARTDIKAFFEFVFVSEHTRRPLKIAPHQRVVFDFWQAHDRSVVMMPIGHSKTFASAAYVLFRLGQDPTTRCAVVSAAEDQAAKVVAMVRDYISTSVRLEAVFPDLKRSERDGDPWTQTAITVRRPPGIRDPSVKAYSSESKQLPGSRLNLIVVDDILSDENTLTADAREKLAQFYEQNVQSRLDRSGPKQVIVINTARHPDDLPHRLVSRGWAHLKMDVEGGVYVQDDAERERLGLPFWDSDDLVPAPDLQATRSSSGGSWCRLRTWRPGESLWEDRESINSLPMTLRPGDDPSRDTVEKKRATTLPLIFARDYMQECRDDGTSMCQAAWIEACKAKARARGVSMLRSQWDGEPGAPRLVFTGIDLAIGVQDRHDDTCFFTFAVLGDGHRLILDVDIGKFTGPQIVQKLFEKQKQYDSVMVVENVGGQDYLRQFALREDASVPLRSYTTNRDSKVNPTSGIPAMFVELYNGAWLIPNDSSGRCHPNVARWIDACLNYVPTRHADDTLMACLFGWDLAKKWGVLNGGGSPTDNQALGMNLLAR